MRSESIQSLRCVKCGSCHFSLDIHEETAQEIVFGTATCERGHHFRIEFGVLDMLPDIDQDTRQEINARLDRVYDPEMERQRPYLTNLAYDSQIMLQSFAANVEQVIDALDWTDRKVLDVGAATAWSTRMLSQKGGYCTAVDISSVMLKAAEAQFAAGVYFDRIVGSWELLPFCDQSFDVVFTSASIHHASDLRKAIHEASRVLKPGGSLVMVNEPVLGAFRNAESFGREDKEQGMNEHIYPLSAYVRALKSAQLHPQIYFPRSLDQQLRREIASPRTLPFRFAQLGWSILRPFAQSLLLHPAHYLVGLNLVAIAQKQQG